MRPRQNCLGDRPSSLPHSIFVVLPFTLIASSFAAGGTRTAVFAHCSSALVVHLDSNEEISWGFAYLLIRVGGLMVVLHVFFII